jgi:hypothetical protein
MWRAGHVASAILVTEHTRLLLKDDMRTEKGFQFSHYDYVLKPVGSCTLGEVQAELDAMIAKLEITGITVGRLSSVPWLAPPVKPRSTKNVKHRARAFRYTGEQPNYLKTLSDLWATETERETSKDDVFVVLERFEVQGENFYAQYAEDKQLANVFGIAMPAVYGYKRTTKSPIEVKDCIGTVYSEWRKKFITSLFTDKVKRLVNHWRWKNESYFGEYKYYRNQATEEEAIKAVAVLGDKHPIVAFVKRARFGNAVMGKVSKQLREAIPRIAARVDAPCECTAARDALASKYPLFQTNESGVASLWRGSLEHRALWFDYVKLVDKE